MKGKHSERRGYSIQRVQTGKVMGQIVIIIKALRIVQDSAKCGVLCPNKLYEYWLSHENILMHRCDIHSNSLELPNDQSISHKKLSIKREINKKREKGTTGKKKG